MLFEQLVMYTAIGCLSVSAETREDASFRRTGADGPPIQSSGDVVNPPEAYPRAIGGPKDFPGLIVAQGTRRRTTRPVQPGGAPLFEDLLPSANDVVNTPVVYPQSVLVPRDLPSVIVLGGTTKDGKPNRRVVLPQVLYLRRHYDGWQDCLERCALHGLAGITRLDGPDPSQSNEPYSRRGEIDGFNDCLQLLKKLVSDGEPETRLRQWCRKSYLPCLDWTDYRGQGKLGRVAP